MKLFICTTIAAVVASVVSQDVPNVLIYGSSGSEEDRAAMDLGYNTTIVGASEWANMTTLDFARYDSIVVPDLNSDYLSSLDFLEQSKDVWSPAITGNIIVIGMLTQHFNATHQFTDELRWRSSQPHQHRWSTNPNQQRRPLCCKQPPIPKDNRPIPRTVPRLQQREQRHRRLRKPTLHTSNPHTDTPS